MVGLGHVGPAGAGLDGWTTYGPSAGHMGSIATAPSDPMIMYAGSGLMNQGGSLFVNGFFARDDGVFKSIDGGETWARAGGRLGVPVISLAVHRTNPNIVYAGTAVRHEFAAPGPMGVLKSTDGGQTWDEVGQGTGEPSAPVKALVIDPVASSTIYAGAPDGVYKSSNGGQDWDQVNDGITGGLSVNSFAVGPGAVPTDPKIIYVVCGSEVFRSEDPEGDGWTPAPVGTGSVQRVVTDPNDPGTVYAGTWGTGTGLWKTEDFGDDWSELPTIDPLYEGAATVFEIAIDPRTPDPNAGAPPVLYVGANLRAYKSTDGGATWDSLVNEGVPSGDVSDIEIDPNAVSRVWIAGDAGLLKSEDAGASWQADQPLIDTTTVRSLLADPDNDSVLFAGTDFGGGGSFFRFNGAAWQTRNKVLVGEETTTMSTVLSMVADPSTDPPTLYGTYFGGVARSTNNGQLWNAWSEGLPELSPGSPFSVGGQSIAMDPQDSDTLYVAGRTTTGVYKTTNYEQDGWVKKSDGLMAPGDDKVIYDLLVTDDAVYAATEKTAGTDGGVYKSTNGGNSWEPKNNGLPTPPRAFALVEDPDAPNTLYAGTVSGVFKTVNGGDSWQQLGDLSTPALSLTIDPQNPDTIYAGSPAGIVSRGSTTGGSWVALPSLNTTQIWALLVRNGTLYAGGVGGVYERPTTAVAPKRKPDALIKSGNNPFIGNGIYNTTAVDQTKRVSRERGDKATFKIKVQNDGNAIDSFKVKGAGAQGPFTAKYTFEGSDVTAQVKAGALTLDDVPKGDDEILTLVIGVKNAADIGDTFGSLVKATSVNAGQKVDAVKAVVKVVRP